MGRQTAGRGAAEPGPPDRKGSDTISKSWPSAPARARPPGGRQHHLVADVEQPGRPPRRAGRRPAAPRAPGSRVAVMVQRQTRHRHHDAPATVQDRRHDAPFSRRELMRAVHVRVPEVRGVRVVAEHRLLGASDSIALLVLGGLRDRRGVLADPAPEPRPVVQPRVHPAPVRRHPAHRHESAPPERGSARRSVAAALHDDGQVVGLVRRARPAARRRRRGRDAGAAPSRGCRRARATRGAGSSRRSPARPAGHDRHPGRAGPRRPQGPLAHKPARRLVAAPGVSHLGVTGPF